MSTHVESTSTTEKPATTEDPPVVTVVTLLSLIPAIYVAFWVIDWTSPTMFSDGSLWRYIAPVVFCVVVPSIIGSTVAAIAKAGRKD